MYYIINVQFKINFTIQLIVQINMSTLLMSVCLNFPTCILQVPVKMIIIVMIMIKKLQKTHIPFFAIFNPLLLSSKENMVPITKLISLLLSSPFNASSSFIVAKRYFDSKCGNAVNVAIQQLDTCSTFGNKQSNYFTSKWKDHSIYLLLTRLLEYVCSIFHYLF